MMAVQKSHCPLNYRSECNCRVRCVPPCEKCGLHWQRHSMGWGLWHHCIGGKYEVIRQLPDQL